MFLLIGTCPSLTCRVYYYLWYLGEEGSKPDMLDWWMTGVWSGPELPLLHLSLIGNKIRLASHIVCTQIL